MSLRILIVDDDPRILQALRVGLEPDGHLLTTVDDGNAAIDALLAADAAGTPYDIVITDLLVPNVGGYTVAATVKRIRPQTPVVLLTGQGESLQKDRRQAYVDRILSKPPRLSELRAMLEELAGKADRVK
jgi:CheY-like chemotaxis protein